MHKIHLLFIDRFSHPKLRTITYFYDMCISTFSLTINCRGLATGDNRIDLKYLPICPICPLTTDTPAIAPLMIMMMFIELNG